MSATYELIADRPEALRWDLYKTWLEHAWTRLLETNPNELAVHSFLESHPCLVPGGEGGQDSIGGHHGAFPTYLFSKAPLPGLSRPVPDFIWVSKKSSVVVPVLIEIERPGKRWFRDDGIQHADLTQAIDQLTTWRNWFQDEAHRLLFYNQYGISEWVRQYHAVNPTYCLIYGRRQEFERIRKISRKREQGRPGWLTWMTYDRLRPLYDSRHHLSVRLRKGQLQVIAVPPTFQLGPLVAPALVGLAGLETAITQNDLISPARREFLLERLPYWRKWADGGQMGSIRGGDVE